MNDRAVGELRALLTRRFGWRLEEDHGQLAQALASRLAPQQSPHAYVAALEHAVPSSPELRALAETLAISETYFFRNPDQYAVLADRAIPAIAARRPEGPLRILSAGAASGEEAYSIAITVLELRKRRLLPPIDILGIDVSRRAIEKARRGRYSAWALRGLPESLRREFFDHDGRHFDVRPEVASMVRFEERNLLDFSRSAPGQWDIVFFRNTFMYFAPEIARGVFEQIAAAMPPGGYLFLGHAETLRGVSSAFELEHVQQTFFYLRHEEGVRPSELPRALPDPLPAATDVPAIDANDDWFHDIAEATARVAALVDARVQPGPAAAPSPAASRSTLGEALALLADERHEAALAALGDAADAEALILRAVLLANMGRVREARDVCATVLKIDSRDAGAYYVQALCDERMGLDADAIRQDEMATYLDDTFAMPQLHLALIARRRDDRVAALRHARRARALFEEEDELRILLFGGGFNRQALMQLCDAHLAFAS